MADFKAINVDWDVASDHEEARPVAIGGPQEAGSAIAAPLEEVQSEQFVAPLCKVSGRWPLPTACQVGKIALRKRDVVS